MHSGLRTLILQSSNHFLVLFLHLHVLVSKMETVIAPAPSRGRCSDDSEIAY